MPALVPLRGVRPGGERVSHLQLLQEWQRQCKFVLTLSKKKKFESTKVAPFFFDFYKFLQLKFYKYVFILGQRMQINIDEQEFLKLHNQTSTNLTMLLSFPIHGA